MLETVFSVCFFQAQSRRAAGLVLIRSFSSPPNTPVFQGIRPSPLVVFQISSCQFRKAWSSPWTPNIICRGLGGRFQLHWMRPRPLSASFLSPWRRSSVKSSPDNYTCCFCQGPTPRQIAALVFFKIKGRLCSQCACHKEAHRNW